MSQPAVESSRVGGILVDPFTSVLARRELHRDVDRDSLPLFGDESWDLSAAVPDSHSPRQAIRWSEYPAVLREACKLYVLALLMVIEDAPRLPYARSEVPSVKTIWSDLVFLRVFVRWLVSRGITAFGQVTAADMDDYLHHVQDLEAASTSWKRRALLAVQRLHAYREVLPEHCRLPAPRLWGGATAAELAGDPGPRLGENRTPRVHPDSMETLLSAALLVAGPIAADLLPTARRLLAMRALAQRVAPEQRRRRTRDENRWGTSKLQLDRLLAAFAERRQALPGLTDSKGQLVIDLRGLAIAGWIEYDGVALPSGRRALQQANLPVRADLLRVTRFSPIGDRPWRTDPVEAAELVRLLRHVVTACFLVIAYLSGIRTGEALNLRRGCISRDADLDLIFMSGQQMKTSPKRRERSPATIPWVVIGPTAEAVAVLEDLSVGDFLFPAGKICSDTWFTQASRRSRTPGKINNDITAFIAWFNSDIAPATGQPTVLPDDHGKINAPRLRRTLAWHIVRRPGGTVAGATQYGHLHTQITQGYANSQELQQTGENLQVAC
jgi:integrase